MKMRLTPTEQDLCFKELRQLSRYEQFYNFFSQVENGDYDGLQFDDGRVISAANVKEFLSHGNVSQTLDSLMYSSGTLFRRGFINAYIAGHGYSKQLVEINEQLNKNTDPHRIRLQYCIDHRIDEPAPAKLNWKQWYETEELIIQTAIDYIDRWMMYNELFDSKKYVLRWHDTLEGGLWQGDGKAADGKEGLYGLIKERFEQELTAERDFYFRITDNSYGEINYFLGPFSLTDLGCFNVADAYRRIEKLDCITQERAELFGVKQLDIHSTLKGYSPIYRFPEEAKTPIITETGNCKEILEKLKLK